MTQHRTIKDIEYTKHRGVTLCLDLHLPAEARGLLPVVVGVPGGGWRSCSKALPPRFLVDHGFAMACVDYRVSGTAIAPANIHDCKAAVRWLRANAARYRLNPDRIGVYGASAGGHLAALLGSSSGAQELEENTGNPSLPSSAVQAVCAVCGPMDLTRIGIPEIRERFQVLYEVTEKYLGGPVLQRTELARQVSPLTYVSRRCPPMLLIHGAADIVVPVEESVIFHEALTKAGATSSLRVIDGMGHSWLAEQTADEVASFFSKHLT